MFYCGIGHESHVNPHRENLTSKNKNDIYSYCSLLYLAFDAMAFNTPALMIAAIHRVFYGCSTYFNMIRSPHSSFRTFDVNTKKGAVLIFAVKYRFILCYSLAKSLISAQFTIFRSTRRCIY